LSTSATSPIQFQRLTDFYGMEETPALSPDGKSVAFVSDSSGSRQIWIRLLAGRIQLVRSDRDAGHPQILAQFPPKTGCRQPRWSPDDSSIAFILANDRWSDDIFYISSSGGTPRRVTSDFSLFSGFSWLPDASGFVYSSSRISTLLYLPTLHLWRISLDGRN